MKPRQLTWPERGQLWLRLGVRAAIAVAVILVCDKVGGRLLTLFMPFLLALAAAALFNRPVRWLQRKLGWRRGILSLLTMIVVFGAIGAVLSLLIRAMVLELISLVENWQSILDAGEELMQQVDRFLQGIADRLPFQIFPAGQMPLERLAQWLESELSGAMPDLGHLTAFATDKARGISMFFLSLVAFLMATYFLCADYPYLRTRAVQRVGDRTRTWISQIKAAALAAFGGYLKAQLLLSIGVFFILLIGFILTGQEYALLLAVGFAVLDFIPLIGAGTVMVPWAIIDLLGKRYMAAAALMAIWGVVVLFRRLAEPKIVGNQTGLSPILSLISIYIGMRLGGIGGMILGPILALVVLNLLGLGLLDNTKADLRMAVDDVAAILRAGREKN